MSEQIVFKQTLYARSSNGKVLEWTIIVAGDKFQTVSGHHDGQLVTSPWTVCKGKNPTKSNATTPEQQALLEAKAKVKLKEKEGYNTDITLIDAKNFLQVMTCIKWEENGRRKIADAFDRGEKVFVQPKFDGHRVIIRPNMVQTRGGDPMHALGHVQKVFAPIFERKIWLKPDGEAYNHLFKHKFEDLSSMLTKKKLTPEEIEEARQHVQFYFFDLMQADETDLEMPFFDRYMKMLELMTELDNSEGYVRLSPTHIVSSFEEIATYEQQYLADGYEGLVIKLNKPYERRENSLYQVKFKPTKDDEFLIIDIIEGKGKMAGAAIFVCQTSDGVRFEAVPKCPMPKRREIFVNRLEYIGRQLTVTHGGFTNAGSLRWPRAKALRDVFVSK